QPILLAAPAGRPSTPRCTTSRASVPAAATTGRGSPGRADEVATPGSYQRAKRGWFFRMVLLDSSGGRGGPVWRGRVPGLGRAWGPALTYPGRAWVPGLGGGGGAGSERAAAWWTRPARSSAQAGVGAAVAAHDAYGRTRSR